MQDLFASRLLANRSAQLVVIIVILVVILGIDSPTFFQPSNIKSIALDLTILVVLAAGLTPVLVTRNLDLSVGSVVGVAAMSVGVLGREFTQLSVPALFGIGMTVGLLIGLINGFVIAYFRVSSIIYTLGVLTVLRGVVYWISGGQQVDANEVNPDLVRLSVQGILGLPWITYIAIAVVAVLATFMWGARFGRTLYAVGSNPRAAELRGLPAGRAVVVAFAISGLCAGIAGVLYVCRYSFVQNTTGSGLELIALAAVVIGGVSIFGGQGSVIGAALGALLLTVITNGFAIVNLSVYWRNAVFGALILASVAVEAVLRKRAAQPRQKTIAPSDVAAKEVIDA
jgi:rhamnose transport system permease protein